MSFNEPKISDSEWVPTAQGFDRVVKVEGGLVATMLVRRIPSPHLKACAISVELGDLRHMSIVHQDHPDEDWGSVTEGAILNADRAFEGLVMQRLIDLQAMLKTVAGDDVIERLLHDERPTLTITINDEPYTVQGYYAERSALMAVLKMEPSANVYITYAQPDGSRHSEMVPGCAVRLVDGMRFTITPQETRP
jgi:hypothetical protein